jgi:hypothetical protein
MTLATAPLPLPNIPGDVLSAAEKDGVSADINPILEMTRRLFPESPMSIVFRPDPEVEDLHFLCVEVTVPRDATVDWLVATEKRWIEETLTICPPGQDCPFTLHLDSAPHE